MSQKKKTVTRLAKDLGISRKTIYKHMDNPAAPKSNKADEWRAFLEARHHETGQRVGDNSPLHERIDFAKLQNLLLDGLRKKRAAEIAEKKLIPKEDVLFFATVFGDIINTALDAIAIKAKVNDATRIELKKICDDTKREIDESSRRELERLTTSTDAPAVQPE